MTSPAGLPSITGTTASVEMVNSTPSGARVPNAGLCSMTIPGLPAAGRLSTETAPIGMPESAITSMAVSSFRPRTSGITASSDPSKTGTATSTISGTVPTGRAWFSLATVQPTATPPAKAATRRRAIPPARSRIHVHCRFWAAGRADSSDLALVAPLAPAGSAAAATARPLPRKTPQPRAHEHPRRRRRPSHPLAPRSTHTTRGRPPDDRRRQIAGRASPSRWRRGRWPTLPDRSQQRPPRLSPERPHQAEIRTFLSPFASAPQPAPSLGSDSPHCDLRSPERTQAPHTPQPPEDGRVLTCHRWQPSRDHGIDT